MNDTKLEELEKAYKKEKNYKIRIRFPIRECRKICPLLSVRILLQYGLTVF